MTRDGVVVRYRWLDGRIETRVFFRESGTRYHWVDEKTGLMHKCMKTGWYTTRADAMRARVEYCDRAAARARDAVKKWDEEAKVAFVALVHELAGRTENEYVGGGAGDGGGEGCGTGEGEAAEAAQAEDDRTGAIG